MAGLTRRQRDEAANKEYLSQRRWWTDGGRYSLKAKKGWYYLGRFKNLAEAKAYRKHYKSIVDEGIAIEKRG